MSAGIDARPGDDAGWVGLSPEVKAYERAKASVACGGRVVRRADAAALDALLATLRPGSGT